jgi:TolB-like protein
MPVRRLIYFSLIHSQLNYGSIIWGHMYDVQLDDLLKIQKRAIRVICGV